jgi:hypothetical protein
MTDRLEETLTVSAQCPTFLIADALGEYFFNASRIPSPHEQILELLHELVGIRVLNLMVSLHDRNRKG